MHPWLLALAAAAAAFGLSRLITRWLEAGGPRALNYAAQSVANTGGTALVPALVLAAIVDSGTAPVAVLGLWFGLLGLLDDLSGDGAYRGFSGHIRAAREGRVTTGQIKALGGWLGALFILGSIVDPAGSLLQATLVALTANMVNLFDLRPLRALKASAPGIVFLGLLSPAAALALGAAVAAYAPREARCRIMLGDTGANLIGATAGAAAAVTLSPQWAIFLLLSLVALHVVAERRGFSNIIASHPFLQRADDWGRME